MIPHRSYAQGHYLLLYSVLRHSDCSCVLNENPIYTAVNNLIATAREAMHLATPYIKHKNSNFPHWFSSSFKYYIKKNNKHFRRYKKSKSDHNYSVFYYYRKLVETNIKRDRLLD
jgi:hypothetical protein